MKGLVMAKNYDIGVIPGDGTGPEVVAEGIKALEAVSRKCDMGLQFREFGLGGDQYLKSGVLLPDSASAELGTMDAIFLGAIGHPGVKPGILETEILLKLRFNLDLYIYGLKITTNKKHQNQHLRLSNGLIFRARKTL